MIKGIIFDLDGVLISTDHYHYLAWQQIATQEGIYFDETINDRLRGVSRLESLEIILEKAKRTYTTDEKLLLATQKNEAYIHYLQELSPASVAAEVIKTLTALKVLNISLAIGSSSKNATAILQRTNLRQFFDIVVDGNIITNSKPHPEVFLKACSLLKLQVTECLVVEDAFAGIDSASAGGFKTVGIQQAKNYSKTSYPIDNLVDILKIVKE